MKTKGKIPNRIDRARGDKTVRNYVESFFEPIRYSKESAKAKETVVSALEGEYASLKKENEEDAFRLFVAKYPDLDALLSGAGIRREDAASWRESKANATYEDFQASFKAKRKWIWIIVALFVIAGEYFLTAALYFTSRAIPAILFSVFLASLATYFTIRFQRNKTEKGVYSVDVFEKLEKLFDRYGRKSINWLMILYLELFVVAFQLISLGVNSKTFEIAQQLSGSLRVIAIVTFFAVKNLLLMRLLLKRADFENLPEYRKEHRVALIFSTIYWLFAIGIYFVFEYYLAKDISVVFFLLYLFSILIFNAFRQQKFRYAKPRLAKPALAMVLAFAIVFGGYTFMSRDVWLTQPYINSVPNLSRSDNRISYNEETGVYTIRNDDESDFVILQLTDIHLGGSLLSYDKDLKALKACYKLIEHTKPDLVVVTGDLSYPIGISSFSFNNTATVQQFAAFMRNVGIPWAFTYGNHDTESVSIVDQAGLNELYQSLSWNTSKNLLYPYTQPRVWGRSNQLIEIRNNDGTLNQALFLVDSNAYTGEGLNKYDYIHDDQVNWYRENVLRLNAEEGKTVSSMAFFHIPLQQYRTAFELYESGSSEATYYFGSNDEKMIDKICCSEYPSAFFDVAKELGSTGAMFCGHDHYNNMSLEYQGIRLTYGMSIDYLVMPGIARDTKQRGGTLITCHPDSSYEIEQIPLTSIE